MFYNYKSKQFSILKGDKLFREKLFSHTQGLVSEIDDDTFLVEEPDTGILWIIKDKKVIYKGVFKSKHAGYHHMLNWTRVIDKLK